MDEESVIINTLNEEEKKEPLIVEEESGFSNDTASLNEMVYETDVFINDSIKKPKKEKNASTPPPPSFKEALESLPEEIHHHFSKVLHGKLTGVWPVKSRYFLKNKH